MAEIEQAPVVRYEKMSRRIIRSRWPARRADLATVYLSRLGELTWRRAALTAGEALWRTPQGVYFVDISVHNVTIEIELPSNTEGRRFRAQITLAWWVKDPIEAARTRLTSPSRLYRPYLERVLGKISSLRSLEQRTEVEEAMDNALSGPVLPQGLEFEVKAIRLHLDELNYGQYQAKVTHQIELERLASGFERNRLSLEQEHTLTAMKREFYLDALRAGELAVIALKLTSDREDVNQVIELLMQQRQLDFEGARGALQALLDAHLVNRKDVADIMARATTVLSDHFSATSLGVSLPRKTETPLPAAEAPPALDQSATIVEAPAITTSPSGVAAPVETDETIESRSSDISLPRKTETPLPAAEAPPPLDQSATIVEAPAITTSPSGVAAPVETDETIDSRSSDTYQSKGADGTHKEKSTKNDEEGRGGETQHGERDADEDEDEDEDEDL